MLNFFFITDVICLSLSLTAVPLHPIFSTTDGRARVTVESLESHTHKDRELNSCVQKRMLIERSLNRVNEV